MYLLGIDRAKFRKPVVPGISWSYDRRWYAVVDGSGSSAAKPPCPVSSWLRRNTWPRSPHRARDAGAAGDGQAAAGATAGAQ